MSYRKVCSLGRQSLTTVPSPVPSQQPCKAGRDGLMKPFSRSGNGGPPPFARPGPGQGRGRSQQLQPLVWHHRSQGALRRCLGGVQPLLTGPTWRSQGALTVTTRWGGALGLQEEEAKSTDLVMMG